MKRGEGWQVDFGVPSGPEQSGQRPAILLQDDALTPALTTVIVLPLTTNLKRLALPTTTSAYRVHRAASAKRKAAPHKAQAIQTM